MTSFSTLDATAQAELVRRGDASALELVDDALARIARLDPALNAVASLDADGARARARGALSGPFAGVPVLAKDLLSVPGQRFSLGARMFAANLARDAFPFVQRMLDAGLIIAGKTTTSELGLLGSTETRLSGVTHNPYDATLSATGSSGGSAAAVAAGMVPMAHASDGGGSIRLPASANGLFGFLPSHGRHVKSGPDDMFGILRDHVLTRSVRDSAGFLRAVEDREADLAPLGPLSGPDRRRLRVAVYEHTVQGESPSGEVRDVLARAARLCGELGHDVRWIDAPAFDGPRLSDAYFTLGGAGIAMLFDQLAGMLGRAPGDAEFEPFTLELAERARRRPPGAVPEALEALRQGARTLNSLLGEHDVVLCPTTPDRTPRLGELSPERDYEALIRRTERFAGYTPIYSFAGAPAMSVPLFTLEGGLPAGCHFAAARGREDVLFALAYELEAALPWAGRWPAVHA